MSMNLHLSGVRQVQVIKTGKISEQTVRFDLYQTPTKVTREALASGNPKQAYIDFVKSISSVEVEDIYADDDIFCEGTPVGTREVNTGAEHLQAFEKFLAMCEAEGYEVEFYEM